MNYSVLIEGCRLVSVEVRGIDLPLEHKAYVVFPPFAWKMHLENKSIASIA